MEAKSFIMLMNVMNIVQIVQLRLENFITMIAILRYVQNVEDNSYLVIVNYK